ncbi:biotin holocarboxylase synthetase [Ascosphaera atra]|nr:biotin holocarboxylase synthetase [Ascosphaera atra]
MDRSKGGPEYSAIIDELLEDDKQRNDFLKACLAKLGLRVNQENTSIPSLSQFHISGIDQEGASKLIGELREAVEEEDGKPYIKDENDTFLLVESSSLHMDSIKDALKETEQNQDQGEQSFDDYNATVKTMVTHEKPPTPKETPYFNHQAFFSNLEKYRSSSRDGLSKFGSQILYAEVITSTNTVLEK